MDMGTRPNNDLADAQKRWDELLLTQHIPMHDSYFRNAAQLVEPSAENEKEKEPKPKFEERKKEDILTVAGIRALKRASTAGEQPAEPLAY
ncbi:MAG: hypothetical protein L6R38_000908 [Xanthoria sp. 2 TBL-2021]|nr:MAG: hypothetical protein L6R38_000908 [Xanthoria sp. 2 TBL-2021]